MKRYSIGVILLVLSSLQIGFGQQATTADVQGVPDYCRYMQEQGAAQRDLLRTPSAEVGPIQPSTGTPPQMVVGVTESVSDLWKSKLTMNVAKTNCQLYGATTEAQMHIFYALPGVEKVVLIHRLDLIQAASDELDQLIADNGKFVEAHNLAKPALYTLQSAKVRLDMSRTQTLTGLTVPYVPPLTDKPLKQLVDTKMSAENSFEKATVRLQKQSAWDIKLEGGEHRQISQVEAGQSPGGLFGEFSLTYSFGKHATDSHLNKSVGAYVAWKEHQFDDVSEQSRILKQQIMDTMKIQQDQLKILLLHDSQIGDNLTSIEGVDSSAAMAFRTQLQADRIVLGVDIKDVQFRLATLSEYLQKNF